eukprot:6790835-Prymnesium_polylepis.1
MLRTDMTLVLVASASAALSGTPFVYRRPPAPPAARWRPWRRRGVYEDRPDMPPLEDVASTVGVAAPWTAPRWMWSGAWRVGHRALPWLHRWDPAAATDTNVNLWVAWLKAIAGNRWRAADGGLAYDMLPSWTRRVVSRPVAWLYPRLHHQNVALRTAYLDRAVSRELEAAGDAPT